MIIHDHETPRNQGLHGTSPCAAPGPQKRGIPGASVCTRGCPVGPPDSCAHSTSILWEDCSGDFPLKSEHLPPWARSQAGKSPTREPSALTPCGVPPQSHSLPEKARGGSFPRSPRGKETPPPWLAPCPFLQMCCLFLVAEPACSSEKGLFP